MDAIETMRESDNPDPDLPPEKEHQPLQPQSLVQPEPEHEPEHEPEPEPEHEPEPEPEPEHEPEHEPEPEPEPEPPVPESAQKQQQPELQPEPEPEAPEPEALVLDTVLIAAAVPVLDTSLPRRGERCNVLLRSRLRETSAMDSPEVGVLEVGETVGVLDTHRLDGGPDRVLCVVTRDEQPLRGWVSAAAASGELLLDPSSTRRPRWALNVDYCADATRASGDTASLRPVNAAPNTLDFCFPAHTHLGRLAGEWEGHYCFVRTLEDGARVYGFCSRLRRASGRVEVICICTRHPWFDCWRRMLHYIDGLRYQQDTTLKTARSNASVGTAVEVFSVSSQQWLPGEITVEPRGGTHTKQKSLYTVVYSSGEDVRKKRVSLHNSAVVRLTQRYDNIAEPLQHLILSLLDATCTRIPPPGTTFSISLIGSDSVQLQRPSDALAPHCEGMDQNALFSALSVSGVIAIFAAMMLEMRLIFVSSQQPRLSSCIHAAVGLLSPFEWQNIFVPVLPRIWLEYITAPMPFIVGLHSSFLSEARKIGGTEDQLVFVMLDDGEVKFEGVSRSPVDSMPPAVVKRLHRRLTSLWQQLQADSASSRVANPVAGGVAIQQDVHAVRFARDVVVAFASFMTAVFGHYRQYLKPCTCTESNDGARRAIFDIDGFIEMRDEGSNGLSVGDVQATRAFLKEFRGSQMFEWFCRRHESLDIQSLQGNVFETLVQQSALRVGEETHGAGSAAIQLEQDDQFSAAELRAKSSAATDLFLASGLVLFYRVELRAMIRCKSARDSQEVGILEEGEIIKVVEQRRVDGVTRVRFDRGWTSIKTSQGVRLLAKLDV